MRQTFGPGIAGAMWRFQDDVLLGILVGMETLPMALGVKVLDQQGQLVHAVAERTAQLQHRCGVAVARCQQFTSYFAAAG